MVAVEKGNEHGVFNGGSRIVVVGDSMFLENDAISRVEDNRTFAVCAVNWLLDQTELLQGATPIPTSTDSARVSGTAPPYRREVRSRPLRKGSLRR